MANQKEVDKWLSNFLKKLLNTFDKRLRFVGHHGSWARGEAKPGSDIDTIVVIDTIESEDLAAYRDIINSMPEGGKQASGLIFSVSELKAWPRTDLVQCYYGCKVLHGSLDGIVEKSTKMDFIQDIRLKAAENLFHSRHYLVLPHDLVKVVHKLHYPFKYCFYALQSWMYLQNGRFILRKDEIIDALSDDDDKEVVRVARDWGKLAENLEKRPLYYIQLLERWSRKMLHRLLEYDDHLKRGSH